MLTGYRKYSFIQYISIIIPKAKVFVDNKLVKEINSLARGYSTGTVGLWLGASARGYYSN
ncbi:MAG: hypothetical protein KAQ62_15785 [Cyclobacteriaceae bacterium]|nr:hypothetical protein [Cyclobacteriaceae bacterium]